MLTAALSALPFLIRLVETIFPSKSGQAKLATVANAAQVIAQGAAAAAAPAVPVVPDIQTLMAEAQKLVDAMKARNELVGPATSLAPADTVDKGDLRRILTIVEAIAPAFAVK